MLANGWMITQRPGPIASLADYTGVGQAVAQPNPGPHNPPSTTHVDPSGQDEQVSASALAIPQNGPDVSARM